MSGIVNPLDGEERITDDRKSFESDVGHKVDQLAQVVKKQFVEPTTITRQSSRSILCCR